MAGRCVGLRFGGLAVGGGVEQGVDGGGVGRLDLEQPGRVGVGVDRFRRVDDGVVDGDDFAGHRRVDVAGRFHRFHHGGVVAGAVGGADFRHFDEDDVAQRVLRELGDADGDGAVGFLTYPFVGGGVLQVCRNIHVWLQLVGAGDSIV